jgi:hypothetical protein
MALLEHNVRRRLPIYNSWKETLNYFVQQNSHTFTHRLQPNLAAIPSGIPGILQRL